MAETQPKTVDKDRIITWAEVEEHTDDKSLWVVVHGKVYDVTRYKLEHPGGALILEEHGGQDSTNDFEDVGHSQDARELMEDFRIGIIETASKPSGCPFAGLCQWVKSRDNQMKYLAPSLLLTIGAAIILYRYVRK